jgi:hypothetical protein
MAFSTEKLSEGNPSIFQALILTGSPNTYTKLNVSLDGISNSWHLATHSLDTNSLNLAVNAPKYPITPEDTRTSPVNF